MTRAFLERAFFKWMCKLVSNEKYFRKLSYKKLLVRLHEIDFYYMLPMDENRAEDGEYLRYRFLCEHSYPNNEDFLYERPCSVLEMMVALALRFEEEVADDPEMGDRTGQWFWNMITNLGLGSMNDIRYDEDYVDDVVYRFLDREYDRDGRGGLFVIEHCPRDMRTVEIWYQMCWYLNDIL